jgi:hypothetical protein
MSTRNFPWWQSEAGTKVWKGVSGISLYDLMLMNYSMPSCGMKLGVEDTGCWDLGQGPLAGSLLCGVFGLDSCERWDNRDPLSRIWMEVVTIQSHPCIAGLDVAAQVQP